MKNGFELDYANNPDLRSLFDSKAVGDECKLEVTIQINEKDENMVKGTIKEIVSEEYGGPDGDEGSDGKKTVEADAKEPVLMIMAGGSGEKQPYAQ